MMSVIQSRSPRPDEETWKWSTSRERHSNRDWSKMTRVSDWADKDFQATLITVFKHMMESTHYEWTKCRHSAKK